MQYQFISSPIKQVAQLRQRDRVSSVISTKCG